MFMASCVYWWIYSYASTFAKGLDYQDIHSFDFHHEYSDLEIGQLLENVVLEETSLFSRSAWAQLRTSKTGTDAIRQIRLVNLGHCCFLSNWLLEYEHVHDSRSIAKCF